MPSAVVYVRKPSEMDVEGLLQLFSERSLVNLRVGKCGQKIRWRVG